MHITQEKHTNLPELFSYICSKNFGPLYFYKKAWIYASKILADTDQKILTFMIIH